MRVSSLSDERVQRLLGRYFVPAWLSRDRYQLDGPDKDEQAELQRIDRQRRERGLPGGTVTVHILAADGTVAASMAVGDAMKPDKLVAFLENYIDREKPKPRTEARPATVKSRPRPEGAATLCIWTRFENKGPNRGLGADRIALTADQAAAFVPDRDARAGSSFTLRAKAVDSIFSYFYPPLPHYDVKKSKLVGQGLTATVVSISDKEVRLRLEGHAELRYPDTGKPTDGRATLKLLGTATVNPGKRTLTDLALTSVEGEYVWYWNNKAQLRKMSVAVELER